MEYLITILTSQCFQTSLMRDPRMIPVRNFVIGIFPIEVEIMTSYRIFQPLFVSAYRINDNIFDKKISIAFFIDLAEAFLSSCD